MNLPVFSHASSVRTSVLIFGERGIAKLLGKQLKAYGFEPFFLIDWIGDASFFMDRSSTALDDMRRFLFRFASLSQGRGLVHPGVTAWAERSDFPHLVKEAGLGLVGCSSDVLAFFENKLNFFVEADRMKIPHLVQSFDPISSLDELEDLIDTQKQVFPLFLKTAFSSHSLFQLQVKNLEELRSLGPPWIQQIKKTFGEVLIFVERVLLDAKTALIPFVRFRDGKTYFFPSSDVSLYHLHRKMIQLTPLHFELTPEIHFRVVGWINQILDFSQFVGVGCFEFLVEDYHAFLISASPRLNTEFHLWEKVCGSSAVGWQLATFGFLSHFEFPPILSQSSWCIGLSFRIYAENPYLNLPYPGLIQELSEPYLLGLTTSESVEIFWNYREGDAVQITDSGCIGHFFVFAQTKNRVIELAKIILNQVWIAGNLQTNEHFLLEILSHPWISEGIYQTGYLDEEFIPSIHFPADYVPYLASIYRELKTQDSSSVQKEKQVVWSCTESRVLLDAPVPLEWIQGPKYWTVFTSLAFSGVLKLFDGSFYRVYAMSVNSLLKGQWIVRFGNFFILLRELEEKKKREEATPIRALSSGWVSGFFFQEGAVVPVHEILFFVECYGRFVPYALARSVRILEWVITSGSILQAGQLVGRVEMLSERKNLSVVRN